MLGAKQPFVRTSVGVVLPPTLVHLHVELARKSGVIGHDFHFRPAQGSIDEDELRYRIAFGNMHGAGLCGLPQDQVDRVRVPIGFNQAAQHFELRHSIDQRQEQSVDTFVGPAEIRKVQFEQLKLIGAIEEAEPWSYRHRCAPPPALDRREGESIPAEATGRIVDDIEQSRIRPAVRVLQGGHERMRSRRYIGRLAQPECDGRAYE
jgi:hypothetical protein